MVTSTREPQLLELPDRRALREWLEANHETSPGVRLAISRKGGRATSLTYEDAVREGLAFGWIDSTAHTLDDDRMTVLFTRRRRGSTWSRSNKERVSELTRLGLMTPAGTQAVEAAKRDGSWSALDEVDAMVVPPDLGHALDVAGSTEGWESASATEKRMALYWIASAKRPETRARRVAAVAEGSRTGHPRP